jgi:hypothetical protein
VAEVVAPHALVDERAGQHLTRVAQEELEQVRLGRRQLEASPAASRVHRAEIERQIGKAEDVRRFLLESAPQECAQPREQLFERERLGKVIVGAGIEALDPVADGVACGQQQDGDPIALAAEAPCHVESVVAGHHHIEDDGIRRPSGDRGERGISVRGELDLVAGELEGALQRLPHRAVVVCDQYEHLRTSVPSHVRGR